MRGFPDSWKYWKVFSSWSFARGSFFWSRWLYGYWERVSALLFGIDFYERKQLLLSACLSHRNSVRLSVYLSHGWISQKWCKL